MERGQAPTAERTWSSMALSPWLTCSAPKPMKPPSFAASAAAWAVVTSQAPKAPASSRVAFAATIPWTARRLRPGPADPARRRLVQACSR